MAAADDDAPTPPASPKNSFARGMQERTRKSTPGIDRPIAGAGDGMTPYEVSLDTKGALSNVDDVEKQFTKDTMSRPYNRRFSRDYSKRPLSLNGGRR